MTSMTSKQRVAASLNHKEPDRVPLDLGGTCVTGISRKALTRFLDYVGFKHDEIEISDLFQQLGRPPKDVLSWLGVDVRPLDPRPSSTYQMKMQRVGDSDRFYDEWGIGWRKPLDSELYYDMFDHPLKSAANAAELQSFSWPDPEDPVRYESLADDAKEIEETTNAAIVLGRMAPGIVELAAWMRGFENFYADLAGDPDFACSLLDIVLEIKMRYWELAIPSVKDRIVVISEADDLASQTDPIISPAVYRKLIKPRHKKLLDHIRKLAPDAFIFFHSCGAIYDLIPDFIEAGVDILNPVQVSAVGMEPKRLKKDFGDAVTFWGGGIDTQMTLPYGTPQQVRDEVHQLIDAFAPGGGFIFNTVHNIQADVPPENLEAMYSALREFGIYNES